MADSTKSGVLSTIAPVENSTRATIGSLARLCAVLARLLYGVSVAFVGLSIALRELSMLLDMQSRAPWTPPRAHEFDPAEPKQE